jgi:hypothetical protein
MCLFEPELATEHLLNALRTLCRLHDEGGGERTDDLGSAISQICYALALLGASNDELWEATRADLRDRLRAAKPEGNA